MLSFFSRLFSGRSSGKDGDLSRNQVPALLSLVPKAKTDGPEATTGLAAALHAIGVNHLEHGAPGEAAAALGAAADLGSSEDYLHYNLALAYGRSGQGKAADAAFRKAAQTTPRSREGDSYALRNTYALEGVTLQILREKAEAWAARYAAKERSITHPSTRDVSSPVRLGFLSGRFCRHAVGFLTLGALEHLDCDRFEIVLYDNGPTEDDYSERFRAVASAVHDISNLSDDKAADLIQSHAVHILFDMGGHSAGGRLGVMARKPAPVQVKWAGGQHGTTGLPQIDFFLTDAIETPAGDDSAFVEKPIRLPDSYCVYTPPPDAPDVSVLPFESNGFITFGSFNNITKLSDGTIQTWSHILTRVPDSRLVLKHLALDEGTTRDRLAALFLSHGISPHRLDMHPPTDQATHLKMYHDVDISLDPMPWSGCVTTMESLWMGVPVLTLPGIAFCHRHSASFLTTVGLESWIANDLDDYVKKAVAFSMHPETLSTLRASLRNRLKTSALCDAPLFGKNLEKVLLSMLHQST